MDAPFTLTLDRFWDWLSAHPNCILRAGTPEVVLYDDDDLHWMVGVEDETTLLVQLLRGKRPVGELLVEREQVAYVEAAPQERPEEHLFELISESEGDRFAAYHFTMAHGFDEEDPAPPGRLHVH